MKSLRYNINQHGKLRPHDNGAWVLFSRYETLKASNTKGRALAKSLQAQVDILEAAVAHAALPEMPKPTKFKLFEALYNIVSDAHTTLQAIRRHRES